ncbi:MAG: 3'(2'),5'-bisphosphate nucleotidase CysQ [Xanthomonadales bacterium]|nr:3'(2'),5'-bisphosphate nucleotidase CysQ [Xanthomonadales bacterium]
MTDLNALIEPVIALTREAADRILAIYNTEFKVEAKADDSPLTKADLASHRTIVAGLSELTPEIPVLSEESSRLPFSERSQWHRYWLVDPLDGTREFVKRNGEFTVNIALIEDHRPTLGVVQVPVTSEVFYAARGHGAFHVGPDGSAQKIHCRDLPEGPLTVAGSRSHPGERLAGYLDALGEHELISMGSSLKFCLVAQGKADLYVRLGKTSEWDTAAAQCVVEEAGGQVTDTAMKPLRYNTKESLLNPEFFVFGDSDRDWSTYLK